MMPLKLKPTRYNGDFMTLNKLSNADLNAIVLAAEEVISALAGENDEVHRDNSSKMCAIWDDLNDRYAPPEVVKAMASELLAYREASREPVADVVAWNKPGEERTCDIRWRRFDIAPGPLFAAPPLAAKVPDEVTFEQAMLMAYGLTPAEAFQKAWNHLRSTVLKQQNQQNEPNK